VTASSTDNGWQGFGAVQIIDGNESRGWRAAANGAQWFKIAFPSAVSFEKLEILWSESTPGYEYKVQVSDDGSNWHLLSDQTKNEFHTARHALQFATVTTKFVRVDIDSTPDKQAPMVMEARFFPHQSA
jgi:hypothetical protein